MRRTKQQDLEQAIRVLNNMAGGERFALSGAYGGWRLEYADGSKSFGGFETAGRALAEIHRFIEGWDECRKVVKS